MNKFLFKTLGIVLTLVLILAPQTAFGAPQNIVGALDFDQDAVDEGIIFTGVGTASSVALFPDLGATGGVSADSGGGGVQGTVDFDVAGTVSGTLGQTLVAEHLLAVNFDGGIVNISNDIFCTTTTINAGGTMKLLGDTTVNELAGNVFTMTNGTTAILDLGTSTLTVDDGTFDINDTNTLRTTIASDTSFGLVDASAVAVDAVSIEVASVVDLLVTGYVSDGTTFEIINGVAAGGAILDVGTITDDSAVLSFTQVTADNDDLVLTAARSSTYNDLATGGNASAAGAALESAGADGPTGDMLTVLSAIDILSASEIEAAMDTMDPDVSAGAVAGSLTALNQNIGTVTSHLTSVRNGYTGLSTGIEEGESSVWAKGFADFSDQDTRSGIRGFESYTYGVALGYDVLADTDVTLGISGGYAYTEVDPKQANLNNTDINSYQGTLYGSYDGGPWYIDGAFGFAWNEYDGSRRIVFGTTSRTANADYNGQQYSGYMGLGYTVDMEGFEITPMTSLQYTRVNISDYTESGAGALNLKVNDQDYDILESGLGLKVAYPLENDDMTFIPELHGMWYYDYIGDKVQTTSKFTGGGASFNTNGASPAQSSWDVGAQATIITKDDISLILDYDLGLKDDFHSHSGAITVKYDF